jgi:CubicO group peptidase (beta-lactamase class C family)
LVPTEIRVTAGPLARAVDALLRADPGSVEAPPPGALLALARGDHIACAYGGFAQRGPGRAPVAMTHDARTDAGSVTKVVATTAAVATLVDAGELDLDAPAARYLPEMSGGATVRDLLEHRAGLWEWWPLYLDGSRDADAVTHAARLPLRYSPREARHYSDLGFVLLGQIVARVAGSPLDAAVSALALEPFGLVETRYRSPVAGAPVLASSTGDAIERAMIDTGIPYPVEGKSSQFARWREDVLIGEVNDGNAFHAFGGAAGHAGLFTTAADLVRFGRGVLASLAGVGPLRAATAREFVTPGPDAGQALGFRIWADPGGPAIGHTGFPGVGFAVLPADDAVAVLITNRLHVRAAPRPGEALWQQALAAVRAELRPDGEGAPG